MESIVSSSAGGAVVDSSIACVPPPAGAMPTMGPFGLATLVEPGPRGAETLFLIAIPPGLSASLGTNVLGMQSRLVHSSVVSTASESPRVEIKRNISGPRHKELEWRRTHAELLKAYTGQWVVLQGDEIVAHDVDPLRAAALARSKGIRVPYVFKVEDEVNDVVRIGL